MNMMKGGNSKPEGYEFRKSLDACVYYDVPTHLQVGGGSSFPSFSGNHWQALSFREKLLLLKRFGLSVSLSLYPFICLPIYILSWYWFCWAFGDCSCYHQFTASCLFSCSFFHLRLFISSFSTYPLPFPVYLFSWAIGDCSCYHQFITFISLFALSSNSTPQPASHFALL